MKKKRVGVIGAGPAGITAAYELCKFGYEVELFELSDDVGGMARSIKLWDQIVDLGPHRFFSSDPRVNKIWLEAAQGRYTMVKRLTRIYYKGKFFHYPIKAANAFYGLGFVEAILCIFSYIKSYLFPLKKVDTFEAWVSNRFGKRLFNIFFRSYSEKLWGIKSDQLDSDFASQRIKGLSFLETIKSFIFRGRTKHKTLVDEFAYPLFGSGAIYKRMKEEILSKGQKIHFNSLVEKVNIRHENGLRSSLKIRNKNELFFDEIISTMPITSLLKALCAPNLVLNSAKNLKFRNTVLVYLLIRGENPFPDQWIYVHSSELKTGRITNFGNWTKEIRNNKQETILCLEYWCNEDDSIWKGKDQFFIELATRELYKSGLVVPKTVIDGKVKRIPKCYPVYSKDYKTHLKVVEKFLMSLKGLTIIGRYGSFKYNNQDHSILMGLLASQNIANNTKHDLWKINTDYEYQESSRIDRTGLVNE